MSAFFKPRARFRRMNLYSPDRLARRYAYQVVLLEELRKAGCPVEFVHRPISDDPHDQLLLQIQGAVAEYERALLGERFRRGKLQKARAGHWVAGCLLPTSTTGTSTYCGIP
ncbi:MAG: recombinase family protein [Terriglobales bacterium]